MIKCYGITFERLFMKPNIHPENYRTVLFFDSSANEGWLAQQLIDIV